MIPTAFGHERFNRIGANDRWMNGSLDIAFRRFAETITAVASLLVEHPEGRRLLGTLGDLALNTASEHHSHGIEFGLTAEQLRQALLTSAGKPRIPWPTSRPRSTSAN